MTYHDIDRSLCAGEPLLEGLDDGFSPPADAFAQEQQDASRPECPEFALGAKSPF